MSNSQQPLSDVLYWLSLQEEKPTAALVDEYCARFPEYADAITTFAIELAVDALGRDLPALDVETVAGPPKSVVLRAISDFQNARYHSAKETQPNDLEIHRKQKNVVAITNPFPSVSVSDETIRPESISEGMKGLIHAVHVQPTRPRSSGEGFAPAILGRR